MAAAKRLALGIPIDINRSSLEDLVLVPGIGEKTAEKILEQRNANGTFRKLDELMLVKGIKEKRFEKLRQISLHRLLSHRYIFVTIRFLFLLRFSPCILSFALTIRDVSLIVPAPECPVFKGTYRQQQLLLTDNCRRGIPPCRNGKTSTRS